ncbi:MAG: hypothetical protein FWC50_03110 [Planctomycetaceae bacterium]|nr:hypothetical protein [Planctomycetaceae bacterium]
MILKQQSIGISKRQARREQIARVAAVIADQIAALLRQGGLVVRVKVRTARTGTVYLKIRVYTSDGRRLKHTGAADHRTPGQLQPTGQAVLRHLFSLAGRKDQPQDQSNRTVHSVPKPVTQ